MAKLASLFGAVVAALLMLGSGRAMGQRVQFPTAVGSDSAPYGATLPDASSAMTPPASGTTFPGMAPSGAVSPGMMPSQSPGFASPAPGMMAPSTAAPGSVYGAAPTVPNTLSPPMLSPSAVPGPATGSFSSPSASFEGIIQPPPGWDPYAPPGSGPTAPLLPNDPYLPSSPFGNLPAGTKLLQEIRLHHHWLSATGSKSFGTNDSELSATFAFPFFGNKQTPLLVTPGFGIHLWDGPETTPEFPVDLPPRAYDAFLDFGWNPQINQFFGGELGARVGVYSDFSSVVSESVRVQARGLGTLLFSPSFQVKAGVFYLDRNRVKLLPAGGVVWTPNADTRFDILFPNPKLAKRLTTLGTYDWWYYLRGEYGGGTWTVRRDLGPRAGLIDSIDYNDLRIALGTEFVRNGGLHGFMEVGFAFDREILYFPVGSPGIPEPLGKFVPTNTVFLGGGLAY